LLHTLGKTPMAKRNISGQSIVQDVRAGLTDSQLQQKYRIKPEAVPYLMRRLVDAGLMTDLEMYQRKSLSESDLMRAFKGSDEAILRCPTCGNRLPEDSVGCAHCESLAEELEDTLIIDRENLSANVAPVQLPVNLEAPAVQKSNSHISSSNGKGLSQENQYAPSDPIAAPPNPPDQVDVVTNILTDINGEERSNKKALLKAASGGFLGKVERLLNLGVDVNSRSKYGNTSLMRAAFKGHVDVAKLLLERKADVNVENSQGNTALIFAIGSGHTELVELLLKYRANARCKAVDGNSALMFACASENPGMVGLLLRAGADVNQSNRDGDTPLLKACDKGRMPVAEELLVAGASINARNKHGNTALMKAAIKGYYSVVRLLLAAGAHVNVKNVYGNTALMKACHRGHFRVAKLLLEAGADVNATDKDGATALTRAERLRQQDVIDLLVKFQGIDPARPRRN
jgi:ankyrin repeat protein